MTFDNFKEIVFQRTNLKDKQIKFRNNEDYYTAHLKVGDSITMSANKTSKKITVSWGEKDGDSLHKGKHKAMILI